MQDYSLATVTQPCSVLVLPRTPFQSFSASNTKTHITAFVIGSLKTENPTCIFTTTPQPNATAASETLTGSSHLPPMDTPATFSAFSPLSPKPLRFPSLKGNVSSLLTRPHKLGLSQRSEPDHDRSPPHSPPLQSRFPSATAPLPSARSRLSLDASPQPRRRLPQLAPACPSGAAPLPSARSRLPHSASPLLPPPVPSARFCRPLSCGPGSLRWIPPAPQSRASATAPVPSARPTSAAAAATSPIFSRPSAEALPRTVAPPRPAPCASALGAAGLAVGPRVPAVPMLRTEKVLQLRGQQGRSVRVVREHYLRPDVPCRSALCRAACPRGEGADGGRLRGEEAGGPGLPGGGRAGAVGSFSPAAAVPQLGAEGDPWAEGDPHGLRGRGGRSGGTRRGCGGRQRTGPAVNKREITAGEGWGGRWGPQARPRPPLSRPGPGTAPPEQRRVEKPTGTK